MNIILIGKLVEYCILGDYLFYQFLIKTHCSEIKSEICLTVICKTYKTNCREDKKA